MTANKWLIINNKFWDFVFGLWIGKESLQLENYSAVFRKVFFHVHPTITINLRSFFTPLLWLRLKLIYWKSQNLLNPSSAVIVRHQHKNSESLIVFLFACCHLLNNSLCHSLSIWMPNKMIKKFKFLMWHKNNDHFVCQVGRYWMLLFVRHIPIEGRRQARKMLDSALINFSSCHY